MQNSPNARFQLCSPRNVVNPEVVSRALATLLVFGVGNALRLSADSFGALSPKYVNSMAIRRPTHLIGA